MCWCGLYVYIYIYGVCKSCIECALCAGMWSVCIYIYVCVYVCVCVCGV